MFTRKNTTSLTTLAVAVAGMVMAFSSPLLAEDKPADDAYPLDYCLVSGQKLGSMGDPVQYDHHGREIKFCCSGSIDEFKKNSNTYLGILDSVIIEQQMPYYPLSTCLVGDQDLTKAEKPVNLVYNNRLVRLHSAKGVARLTKDPATYLAKLDSAVVAAQVKTYPLATCVVSGMKLGSMGNPVDYVQGNRLVRFCCAGCIDAFQADPVTHLAKIDAAMAPKKDAKKANAKKEDKPG